MDDPPVDLLSDDLLADFDLLPLTEDGDNFASFLELLDSDLPPDPAQSFASCKSPVSQNCQQSASAVPLLPPPQRPQQDQQIPEAVAEDPDAARLERIRAKNRRGQAKYREKLKREKQELESRITQTKSKLSDSNQRYRDLREDRASAVVRVNTATAELDRLAFSNSQPPHCTAGPAASKPATSPECSTEQPQTTPSALWLRARHRACVIPAFGFGAGIYASTDSPPRDIASYRCCCSIALTDILAHLPPDVDFLASKDLPHHVPQAIREFQAAACANLATPREDVCWFVQFPQRVASGLHLSHSASIASAECRMTLMLFGEALALEAGLLLEQHAALVGESAAPAATSPREAAAPQPSASPSPQDALQEPPCPDPDACRRHAIRCGVNQTCSIADAVDGVIAPILHSYRRTLRRHAWRTVCVKALRKARATLATFEAAIAHEAGDTAADGSTQTGAECSTRTGAGAQQGGSPGDREGSDSVEQAAVTGSGGAAGGSGSSSSSTSGSGAPSTPPDSSTAEGGADCADECQKMWDLMALLAHRIWSALQAGGSAASEGEEVVARSRAAVETRMLEVNMGPAVSCVVLFQQAPLTVRQLCQEAGGFGADLDQVEQHQRRLLRSLALQPDQRAHCAQIWRQWYKKRRLLDREFDAAADAIADRLPSAADLPTEFAMYLDRRCQDSDDVAQVMGKECRAGAFDSSCEQLIELPDKLIGVTGTATEQSAAMLQALKAVHATDGLLYEHVLFLTVMPAWYLTQVQHTQLHASMLDEGITLVDNLRLCQAAAQEERWKEVFSSLTL